MSEEDERTCYVASFSTQVTDELLEELFVQVGPVEKVHLMEKGTHRFALVLFLDMESVPFAIETLNGVKLFDMPITVKPRNGTKQEEEYKKCIETKRRNSKGFTQINPSSSIDDSIRREYSGSSYPVMENSLTLQSTPTSLLDNNVFQPIMYTPPHSAGRLELGYKIPSFLHHSTNQRRDSWHSPSPNSRYMDRGVNVHNQEGSTSWEPVRRFPSKSADKDRRYGSGGYNHDRRDDLRNTHSPKKNSFTNRRDKRYNNRKH